MVLQRLVPTSPPQSTQNTRKNLIRDLLRTTIRDNTFRFHNDFFLQTKGVAMGTKCAPPFANLFLGSLEEKALAEWTGTHPLLWLRFLDDILMLWDDITSALDTFLIFLNSRMSSIKFTMDQDPYCITFLDLEIYKGPRFNSEGVLDIKSFKKPQTFLHFESCHPRSIFTTIVKGEIVRALRASSDPPTFSAAISQLLNRFQERGYPKPLLLEIASTICYGHRPSLIQKPSFRTTLHSSLHATTQLYKPKS